MMRIVLRYWDINEAAPAIAQDFRVQGKGKAT